MPLVAGSGFAGMQPGGRGVAMIDDRAARRLFPKESPVGRSLIIDQQRLEIVGVVPAVAVGWRGEDPTPGMAQIYRPIWQAHQSPMLNAIVRLQAAPPPALAAVLRRAVYDVDPSLVLTIQSFEDTAANWSRTERQMLIMLQVLAALALVLSSFGMFAVMAYAVARRRSEFGLRLVLGASPAGLLVFVLKRGLMLAGLGVAIGLALAAAFSRWLQSELYETGAHDPMVYIGVTLLLLTASATACWFPARRAARVDPMVALRCE